MAVIGYARVSTTDQDLSIQRAALKAAGCRVIRAEKRSGGFGAVRATAPALPMCQVEVERCYESRGDEIGCVNPEFSELPLDRPTFRVFAQVR